jgi:hypothetical protein
MSSLLSGEIAKLASEARRRHIYDHRIIEKLTIVVGYGHLIESHPDAIGYLAAFRRHLEAFTDLARDRGHAELCEYSGRILESVGNGKMSEAA